jgi:acid phosphatase
MRSAACAQLAGAILAGCSRGPTPIYEAERQVAAYIEDGAYMRDFSAVLQQARAHLHKRALGDTANLAIALDIDETALSNWPAYRLNNYARVLYGDCDMENGPCGVFAYQEMGKMPALEPTLALVREAKDRSVKVSFISGRPGGTPESHRAQPA